MPFTVIKHIGQLFPCTLANAAHTEASGYTACLLSCQLACWLPFRHCCVLCKLSLVHVWPAEGASCVCAGFSVTGVAKEDMLMSKGGMQAGQAIILTKALGTGTIMAAAMRRKAKGRWITGRPLIPSWLVLSHDPCRVCGRSV